jgi:TorA maturation chaperone TorD
MRDPGLREAIAAVGGVSELARRLGVAQPSISNWTKVPSERVLSVESASGVRREVLRPDLYVDKGEEIDEVDAARASEYALLGHLLRRAPDEQTLRRLAKLRVDPTPLGLAHAALAQAASASDSDHVGREFFDLFIGLARGELLPYGSYYLTGFLHERPLARLRGDLAALGIARADNVAEPEDHAGILCEIMAGLIRRDLDGGEAAERSIFTKHMAQWIGRFFADLERAEASEFYRAVGTVGRVFIDIETEAFALPA